MAAILFGRFWSAALLFLSLCCCWCRSSPIPPSQVGQYRAPTEVRLAEWRHPGEFAQPEEESEFVDFGQRLRPMRRQGIVNKKDEAAATRLEASTRLVQMAQQLRPKTSSETSVSSPIPAASKETPRSVGRDTGLVRQRVRNSTAEASLDQQGDSSTAPVEAAAEDDIDSAASEQVVRLVAPILLSNSSELKVPDAANVTQVMNAEILRENARLRYRSNATANYLSLLRSRTVNATQKVIANRNETVTVTPETTTESSQEPAWKRRISNRRKPLTSRNDTSTTLLANVTTEVPVNEMSVTVPVTPTSMTSAKLDELLRSTADPLAIVTLETSISEPTQVPTATVLTSTVYTLGSKSTYSTITRFAESSMTVITPTVSVEAPKISPGTVSAVKVTSFSRRITADPITTTPQYKPSEVSQTVVVFATQSVPESRVDISEQQSTQTTTPTTTTTMTTTVKSTSNSNALEDILQRLVPTKDDNSPYLNSPVSRINHALPSSNKNGYNRTFSVSHEIRPTGAVSVNSTLPESSETKSATSIYIVGVVAVFPLAGIILWLIRIRTLRQRNRLKETDTSSESGFRKNRLQPLPLTPSKQGRIVYGVSDKEGLVPTQSPQSPWEFPRSRLRLQTLIGEGNFGQVWKAEAEDICECEGTLLVAVKTVKDGASTKDKQELLREMKIMQQLGPHPNVVALLGCCTEQEPFLLIMEYVMYGRLLTFLRDHRSQQSYYNYSSDSEALTSRDLTTFAYCVAKGMEYIASKGIVHRDLAARNVLVDHNKLCKVADFGLSRNVRDSGGEMYEQRVRGALPIRWMAPESLIHSIFTQKSDVWSFGILIWEIVTLGSTPYPGMEAREVMRRVKDGHRLERPNHCRPELYRLMSRCWNTDPARRPDFSELKTELGRLLDDSNGCVDLDNFQDSIYVPLESPSDESEKV